MAEYNLLSFPGETMQKLHAAADLLRAETGSTLLIPPGDYLLTDARSRKIQERVRSGAWGVNPQKTMFSPDFPYSVGLDLHDCRDVTVLAHGARFLMDGFMEPVSVRNSVNTRIEGLTLDHRQKPFSCATIIGIDGEDTVLFFEPDASPTVEMSCPRNYLYDPKKRRFCLKFLDWHSSDPRPVGENLWRARIGCTDVDVGRQAYFVQTFHFRPSILISHSENTFLTDVTIHSQPGMGIVGFKSKDIFIDGLRVVPSPGYQVSTNTDATHFACCRGTVAIENSVFQGHGDDAVNIHNYYYTILSSDQRTCTVQVRPPDGTHSQEPDFPLQGFRLQLVDRNTLVPVDEYLVVNSSETECCTLELDHSLPEGGEYLFANLTETPTLIFRGNSVSDHLARGVLCKTHRALIENNTFSRITGTAVEIAAEAFWGEGTVTKDVTVRENAVYDCGFCDFGRVGNASAVAVVVSCVDPAGVGLHERVVIENNRVRCPADADKETVPFFISSVDTLVLRGNECEEQGPAAVIQRCVHVETDCPEEKLLHS